MKKILSIFTSLTEKIPRAPKRNIRRFLPITLLIIIVLGVIALAVKTIQGINTSQDPRIEVRAPKASQTIAKEFSFPLVDSKGKEITRIKYTVDAAELRDEIIVKGQRASSVRGRTFLIIPIKITNEFDKALEIQAKDYIRLVVNNNDKELRAADVHSDPVTVQALSTKPARLGFAINDTDTGIKLIVGELNGTKETIEISL